MVVSLNPLAWIIAVVLLVLFWPLAQRFRHKDLGPLAAYLLFTSVFALVGSAAFMLVIWIGRAFFPEGTMFETMGLPVVLLIAVVPALVAAFLIVRRPQNRRMPR